MANAKADWQEVRSLGELTCSSYDCEHDLHCFRRKKPRGASYRNGHCCACKADLIDWHRVDKKDLRDADHTFKALQYEMFRHVYWHKTIDERAIADARSRGLRGLSAFAEKRILKYVGPSSKDIFRDGTQTPLKGNLIYYAQHATATCCRKCAEEWHGIDRNRPLTQSEIRYMVDLVMLYVKKRVPDLAE
jgi:hypothetical protein